MNIKDIVKNQARFSHYFDGNLWYTITFLDKDHVPEVKPRPIGGKMTDFTFPVPIEDIGNATFNATEKGMLMMRYVRKHMKTQQEAKESS